MSNTPQQTAKGKRPLVEGGGDDLDVGYVVEKVVVEEEEEKAPTKKTKKEKGKGKERQHQDESHIWEMLRDSPETQAQNFANKYKEGREKIKQAIHIPRLTPEHFVDTRQDGDDFTSFVVSLSPKLTLKLDYHAEKGSPIITVVCTSSDRCLEMIRLLSPIHSKNPITRLWSAKMKIPEQEKILSKKPVTAVVGTPNRLHKLCDRGVLKLHSEKEPDAVHYLLVDASWQTVKTFTIFDICNEDFFLFFEKHCSALVASGKLKVCLF